MKIEKIIGFYLPFKTTVVQFSPIRSGSTLVFNILQELFPKASIEKQHNYGWYFNHLNVVASVRSPYDCIGSVLKAHKRESTDENVEWATGRFLTYGGNEIVDVADRSNVLLLRYEDFLNHYKHIYDSLEPFLGIEIDEETRARLDEKFSMDSVKQIMGTKKQEFADWDEKSKIHGNHISNENGRVGYGREMFSEAQVSQIEERCAHYIKKFNY